MIDGLLVSKIVADLKNKVESGKIQKIYQITDNELLIKIRANHTNYQLLNSIDANKFRLHLTNQEYSTLEVATNFTMVLRKQLEGGIIKDIYQHEADRTIVFEIVKFNELRDEQVRYLIFELIGRHSNTILCDSDYMIVDTLKKVPLYDSLSRLLAKNAEYEFIATNNKLNPFKGIEKCEDYQEKYQGFSRYLNDEFKKRADPQKTLKEYQESHEFFVYPRIISAIQLTSLEQSYQVYDNLDTAFDIIYSSQIKESTISQVYKKELKEIKALIKKNKKKVIKLQQQYQDNLDYQQYQKQGTLLYDNIYLFDKNKKYDQVDVFDYESNQEVTIKLDNRYPLSENARRLLTKYNKLKKSFNYLEQQINHAQKEIELLEHVLTNFEFANTVDAKEIFNDLVNKKILRTKNIIKKNKKNYRPNYETYDIDDCLVYVGKNDLQNDYLTFTKADKKATWLHIYNQPGAHVIIQSESFSNEVLEKAAKLAVYYAKTQPGVTYEVQYTTIENIKKIKGSRVGQVSLKKYQTILVEADNKIINEIKKVK